MKVVSFDQASRVSGWSYWEDGKYISSGIIDLSKSKDTTDERSKKMGLAICDKIAELHVDRVFIENVQQQSGVSTVILLARIQGMIIGWCYAHGIQVDVLSPTQWRAALEYKQGPGVKRGELKQQSSDYVLEHLGFDSLSEDENEAICIGYGAHKIFNI